MNKNYVNSCLRWLANELVPFYNNGGLPKALMSKIDTFYTSVGDSFDWFNLSKEDVQRLGFLNWEDSDDNGGVWFIPSWLYPIIPEGMILYNKNGEKFEFTSQTAPREVMYGCLTFGVVLEEEELYL